MKCGRPHHLRTTLYCLGYLDHLFAREEAESALEKTRRKTLGQLLGQLKSERPEPSELVERLDQFVEYRNWLAHRSRAETRKLVYQPSRTHELFSRLDWIAAEALALMKLFAEELIVHSSHTVSVEKKLTEGRLK